MIQVENVIFRNLLNEIGHPNTSLLLKSNLARKKEEVRGLITKMKSYIRDSGKALLLMTVGQKIYIFYGLGKFVVILKIFTQALYLSVLK